MNLLGFATDFERQSLNTKGESVKMSLGVQNTAVNDADSVLK